jgi:hypothetical protein
MVLYYGANDKQVYRRHKLSAIVPLEKGEIAMVMGTGWTIERVTRLLDLSIGFVTGGPTSL